MYIIIVGCGRVGSQLAHLLADNGHNVVAIDKDAQALQKLGADFNGLTLAGDGFDVDLLKEAGAEGADVFCTVTDNDNANIMSGQVAKRIFKIPKVIARINDVQYAHIYQELGIDAVNSTVLLTSAIRDKIMEAKASTFLLEQTRIVTVEVEASAKTIGKRVEQLKLPGELLIVVIIKGKDEMLIARAKDLIEEGMRLIAIVKTESLPKARKVLGIN